MATARVEDLSGQRGAAGTDLVTIMGFVTMTMGFMARLLRCRRADPMITKGWAPEPRREVLATDGRDGVTAAAG